MNFGASIYLSIEIIVSGVITLLGISLFSHQTGQDQQWLETNEPTTSVEQNSTFVFLPKIIQPPKYEEIFPPQAPV